jgi:hypothetical protein|tara:strand:- start:98 stop:256 length:159 start_codon:yes stop_codon:yes gene_type:complete
LQARCLWCALSVIFVITIRRVLELVAMFSTDAMHQGRPSIIIWDIGLGVVRE